MRRSLFTLLLALGLWHSTAWSENAALFTEQERAWIAQHPVVRVAIDPDWAPVEYMQDGQFKGLSAEYIAAVARVSGLEFQTTPGMNWAQARNAIMEGSADILPASSKRLASARLREQMEFSNPYFTGSTIIVTLADAEIIFEPQLLNGKKVAVKGGGAYERYLRENYPLIEVVTTTTPAQALELVATGQAYAAMDLDAAVLPMLKRRYRDVLHVAGTVVDLHTVVTIGVRKDAPLLLSIINKSLATLTARDTDLMMARWLESSDYGSPSWSLMLLHYKWEAVATLAALLIFIALSYRAFWAQQRAQQSEREKAMFLAVMSHEIRTPMNAIMASVELLARGPLQADQARLANAAVSNSNTLLELLNDVLDYSKIEANKVALDCAPTNLQQLIRDAAAMAAVRAQEKGLALNATVQMVEGRWPVIDAHRVRQIVTNLLSNAVKFTERGSVELNATVEAITAAPLTATLTLRITDTGIGIARRQQTRLFKAFSQADESTTRRFGGTGLGLTICRDLVNLMQGSISIDSEPGKGTTMLVTLPVALAPAESAAPVEVTAEDAPVATAGLNLLVVEDHPENQFVIEQQLKTLGYTVTLVDTGQAGLDALASRSFDALLLDCNLPDMDGYTVAARLRQRELDSGQHTPIIAISALVGPEHAAACLEAGIDGLLSKPLRIQELKAIIELWCEVEAAELPAAAQGIDLEVPLSLHQAFVRSTRGDLSAIHEAIHFRDWRQVGRLAHRVAGAALMLKLGAIVSEARELEQQVAQGASAEQISETVQRLETTLNTTCGEHSMS